VAEAVQSSKAAQCPGLPTTCSQSYYARDSNLESGTINGSRSRGATRKAKNMVYPQNIEIAETEDILSGIGDKRYNFLFLGCGREKSEFLKNIRE